MSDMKYEEGKIYLRDVRSGQVYLYERHLAANRNFEAIVPNPVVGSEIEQELDCERQ